MLATLDNTADSADWVALEKFETAAPTMKHPFKNQPQEVLAGLVERVTYLEWEHGPGSSEIADSIPDVPWHKYKRTLEPPACARIDEKTFQVWLVFIFSADSRFCIEARARTKGVRHFAQTPFVAEVPRSSSPRHVIANKIDFQGNLVSAVCSIVERRKHDGV